MNTTFVTFLRAGQKEEELLENKVKAYVWDYDTSTKTFNNSRTIDMNIETRIPTWQSKKHNENDLRKCVENYKNIIKSKYETKLAEIRAALEKTKAGTKKRMKLEHQQTYIQRFLSNIDKRMRLEGPFGKYAHKVYHFVTPFFNKKEQHYYLRREFMTGSHYNTAIGQRYLSFRFPFAIVDERNKQYVFLPKRLSTEALLKAPGLAFDFETHNWETIRVFNELIDQPEEYIRDKFFELLDTYRIQIDQTMLDWMDRKDYLRGIEKIINDNKDERITVVSFINLDSDKNYLVTTLDCGRNEIIVDIPGKNTKIRILVFKEKNQDELMHKTTCLFQEINPVFVYGHHQLKFDYGKGEELTGIFYPGVEETKPLFISQAAHGFIVQRILPGRLDLDASGYSRNYMRNYNNKLDTVFRHVCGIESPKTMTHTELFEKTILAEQGSKKDALDILYYAAQDSMKSYMIGEALKHEHILLSKMHASLPARIDTVSKDTLSEDYWVRWSWRFKRTYPFHSIPSTEGRIRIQSQNLPNKEQGLLNKIEQFKRISFDEFSSTHYFYSELKRYAKTDKKDLFRVKKGLYQGILVALFPFQNAFKKMLIRDSIVEDVYEILNKTSDAKQKYRLLTSLEKLAEFPLFKAADLNMEENWFAMEFNLGFSKKELDTYREFIARTIEQAYNILKQDNPLNMKEELFLLPYSTQEEFHNIKKNINETGLGTVLGKGIFLSGTRGRFAGNLEGELFMQGIADPESRKGERCLLERKFYETYLTEVLMNNNLRAGLEYLLNKAILLREGRISREEIMYEREVKKAHTDYSIRAHQLGYVKKILEQKAQKGDLVTYKYSYTDMLRKLFARFPNGNRTKTKGTISEIVEWVFDFTKNSMQDQLLTKIYLGEAEQKDINKIIAAYERMLHLKQ